MAEQTKQTFVGSEDRPEITPDPDTPVTQLRVRDLIKILGQRGVKPHPKFEGHSPLKEFFDKPFPEVVTAFGISTVPGAQANPDPTPWVTSPTGEPDPDPWKLLGHWNVIVDRVMAMQGLVKRLEDQVSRLAARAPR